MWKVDDFEKKNDHYTILLNYLNYACQRFDLFIFVSVYLCFVYEQLPMDDLS